MSGLVGERPAVSPPGGWSFPVPREWTQPNGVRVVCFDVPGARLAAATVLLDAPLAGEPRDREGVTTVLGATLDEGTRARTGEQFADEMALHGADLGVSVGMSGIHVTLDVAVRNLRPAFELLAEAVTGATFPEAEVARHVQLRLAAIAQQRSVPGVRASWALDEYCFDPASRHSRPEGGTADTVAGLTRDDVAELAAQVLAPDRATVVLAADLTATDVEDLLGQVFGSWSADSGGSTASAPPPPGAAEARARPSSIVVLDRPGSVQSALAIGLAGPDRTDPHWPDLLVAAHALGGGLSSRLMADLREDKGYTYGIHARFSPFASGGRFTVSTAVDTAVTAPALSAIRTVIGGLRAGGLTAAERDDAVDYHLGASPLGFQTPRALVAQASGLLADGLPADWLNVLRDRLREVSADSASTAFAHTVPADLTTVVVGDAAQVLGPLSELDQGGLGDVQVVPAG